MKKFSICTKSVRTTVARVLLTVAVGLVPLLPTSLAHAQDGDDGNAIYMPIAQQGESEGGGLDGLDAVEKEGPDGPHFSEDVMQIEDFVGGETSVSIQSASVKSAAVNVAGMNSSSSLVQNIRLSSGRSFRLAKCKKGDRVYTDRGYTFTKFSHKGYHNELCILTANDDKNNSSDDLLSFDITKSARIRIFFDRRASQVPSWFGNKYKKNSKKIYTSDGSMKYFEVYSCDSKPGRITLGGPKRGSKGVGSMYVVQIIEIDNGKTDCSTKASTNLKPIPSNILDGKLWELEGKKPHPLVNPYTLEFVPLKTRHTTPNGNGWRHEYKIKENHRGAMSGIYEEFQATVRVDMSNGGKTIVAQHHASNTGTLMKLYVADSKEGGLTGGDGKPANGVFDVYVRLRDTAGNEKKKSLGTIRSGDSFTLRVLNNYGKVTVKVDGHSFTLRVKDDPKSYLKFGNYLQSQDPRTNQDCGDKGDEKSFEQCYKKFGITKAKVTMTNVSYTRR